MGVVVRSLSFRRNKRTASPREERTVQIHRILGREKIGVVLQRRGQQVVVDAVVAGSLAAAAGVHEKDVIIEIGGVRVGDSAHYAQSLFAKFLSFTGHSNKLLEVRLLSTPESLDSPKSVFEI